MREGREALVKEGTGRTGRGRRKGQLSIWGGGAAAAEEGGGVRNVVDGYRL